MITALMMGRKGSLGFPGKNTMKILGRPLCCYPLMAVKNTSIVDKIYISTDDEEIMSIGTDMGAEIITRPKELCAKEALGEYVFKHGAEVIEQREAERGNTVELIVLLLANSATLLSKQIEEGIRVLRDNPDYDSAVTVSRYNMWSPLRARKIDQDGLLKPFVPLETFGNPQELNCDRDSQGDVWFADMGISIVRPRCLRDIESGLLPQKWMGQKIYPIRQWGGCDIDYEYQVAGIEYWLRKNGFSENTTPYE